MKFVITLTTVASVTVTVEAADEDTALDRAYESAKQFSGQYHAGSGWVGDLNDEWQFEEPHIKELG